MTRVILLNILHPKNKNQTTNPEHNNGKQQKTARNNIKQPTTTKNNQKQPIAKNAKKQNPSYFPFTMARQQKQLSKTWLTWIQKLKFGSVPPNTWFPIGFF
jgi:hypothetical protein